MEFDQGSAKELHPQLAQAYRHAGFSLANRGDFNGAVCDFKIALKLDKDNPQNHRLCGLAYCEMAQVCHAHNLAADEKQMWNAAIAHLGVAQAWLEPELKYSFRDSLEDARSNLGDYKGRDGNTTVGQTGFRK